MKNNNNIIGLMLESYIKEGKQKHGLKRKLKTGISVTDACISLPVTIKLIEQAYNNLR